MKPISLTFNRYFFVVHTLCTDTIIRTEDTIVNKIMVPSLTELTVEWRRQILSVKEGCPGKLKTKL